MAPRALSARPAAPAPLELSGDPRLVQAATATHSGGAPHDLMHMIGERTLGSPLREICTMGSERGDEYKRLCSLGEGTGSKESDYSEAPQRATVSRLVPTHQPCQGMRRKASTFFSIARRPA